MSRAGKIYRFLALLYFMFLVGIVVLADRGVATWLFWGSTFVPFGDKICHLILVGLLCFLLNGALQCRKVSFLGVRIHSGSLVAGAFVLAEEISQFWVVSRNMDIVDLIFDFAGIFAFGALASLNLKMKRKRQVS